MRSVRGYSFILSATLFWGVSATVAQNLFTGNVGTLVLVQTRMTLSCLLMLAFLLLFRRTVFRVRLKDLYRFALLGILGNAGSNFFYYYAIRETNVATAILLQYMAPLFVLTYAAVTHEEVLSVSKVAAAVVSLAGCTLAVGGTDLSHFAVSGAGLAAGFGAALSWSFTNVMLRHILRDYSTWTTIIYSWIFASLFWFVINPPWLLIGAGYSSSLWLTFLGFAVISILIPHTLYFSGVRYLTASRAIITATFEPVVAIVSAYFIVHESLTPVRITGAVMVLCAIAVLQLKQEAGQEIAAGTDAA